MLVQLEAQQKKYCSDLVQSLREECPTMASCKVKSEWNRSSHSYARKWHLSISRDEFDKFKHFFVDFQIKMNVKNIILTNSKMQALNDNIRELSATILREVEQLIEEDLILELRRNLPKIFTVVDSLAKLDVTLAFIEYITASNVFHSRPKPLNALNSLPQTPSSYLNINSPAIYMK